MAASSGQQNRSGANRNVWVFQRELEDFFRTREAAAGVKSNHGAMVEALLRKALRNRDQVEPEVREMVPVIHVRGRAACAAYIAGGGKPTEIHFVSAPAVSDVTAQPFISAFGVPSGPIPTATDTMRVRSAPHVDARALDDQLIRYSETSSSRRFRETYRTLEAMPGVYVAVLHLLFGDPAPGDYPPGFGDVAPIVHLTEEAEALRVEVAGEDSKRRTARLGVVFSDEEMEKRRNWLSNKFWLWARKWARLERRRKWNVRAIKRGDEKAHPRAAALRSKVDEARRMMKAMLDEYQRPVVIRAITGAQVHAEHQWTARDAIRHVLTFRGPRSSDGKPVKAAYDAWKLERGDIIGRLRHGAERLRLASMRSYSDTKYLVRA